MHIRLSSVACALSLLSLSANGLPTPRRRAFESISILDDVLLFDSPAFQDPKDSTKSIASFQTFVSLRAIDASPLISAVGKALEVIGLDIKDEIETVTERLKLFAAVGLPGKEVELSINGCNAGAKVAGTSGLPDLGLSAQNVSIGSCSAEKVKTATVKTDSFLDNRAPITANVIFSPPEGFAVISDIDDTIKVSNVLDKLALAKSTLLDQPQAVARMPELFRSLSTRLDDPAFFYVSGSPYQLYPFLHGFIRDNYPQGPIMLQNLTVFDVQSLLNFAGSDGVQEYKTEMIDRIVGMYPKKKFIAIGDSTQKDPETYAEAFRKYPNLIACSWIRQVDGANNTDERFAAAFAGVPKTKFRLFKDNDISILDTVDVASGQC